MIQGGSYTSVFVILLGVYLTHVVLYRTAYHFHTFTYYNLMNYTDKFGLYLPLHGYK